MWAMLAGIVILLSTKNSLAILYLRVSHRRLCSGIDASTHLILNREFASGGTVKNGMGCRRVEENKKGPAGTQSLSIHKP